MLDIGCGAGQWLADLETWGVHQADLHGIDLIEDRSRRAQARLPHADIREGDATALPWPADAFDLVMQSTAFSSILDPAVRAAVAREADRVLAPGGVVLWDDLAVGNPRNRAVAGLPRRAVAALFPGYAMRARRTTLAAPLARRVVPRAWLVADALERTRLLNTHLVAVLQKSPGAAAAGVGSAT